MTAWVYFLQCLAIIARTLRLNQIVVQRSNFWFYRVYSKRVVARIFQRTPRDSRDRDVCYFLTAKTEGAKLRRLELNRYLETAFRYRAVDKDLFSRLRSHNWEQFIQAVSEIQAGYFFEQQAGFRVSFRPRGSGTSIGDLQIAGHGAERIFVEVKAPFREAVEGMNYGNDADVIRQNLRSAYGQLSDGHPSIVVLSGKLRVPISDPHFSGLLETLYGQSYFAVPISLDGSGPAGAITTGRHQNGFFQVGRNRKLSAVVTLEDRVTDNFLNSILKNYMSGGQVPVDMTARRDVLKYVFRIYHNPHALRPIPVTVFQGWRQFAKSEDGTRMLWIE